MIKIALILVTSSLLFACTQKNDGTPNGAASSTDAKTGVEAFYGAVPAQSRLKEGSSSAVKKEGMEAFYGAVPSQSRLKE